MLEDTLRALPLLWGKGSPDFVGKTYRASELTCYPRPIQEHIPILIGGGGEERTLLLVAEHADACNLFGSPEQVARKVEILKAHCADVSRDPFDIEVTHRLDALADTERGSLDGRVNKLRSRDQSVEDYARRSNAGTVDDLVNLFHTYAQSGADHTIVAIPDVEMDGAIEMFGQVIERVGVS